MATVGQAEKDHIKPEAYSMWCMPGVVVVEMVPRSEKTGLLHIPDVLKNQLRLDIGVVIGVGGHHKVAGNPGAELSLGDVVVVRHDRGVCLQDFGWEETIARSEVRMYTMNGGPGSYVHFHRYRWDEAILGALVNETVEARGNRVIVKMGPRQKKAGMIDLVWGARDPVCEVLSVGRGAAEYGLKPGDKVFIPQNALQPIEGYGEDLASALVDCVGFGKIS